MKEGNNLYKGGSKEQLRLDYDEVSGWDRVFELGCALDKGEKPFTLPECPSVDTSIYRVLA